MSTCPCCGGPMSADIRVVEALYLPNYERRVLDALLSAFPRAMYCESIASVIYSLAPNGGPVSGRNNVHVYLHRIRRKLEPHGWTVGSDYQGGPVRLRPLDGPVTVIDQRQHSRTMVGATA